MKFFQSRVEEMAKPKKRRRTNPRREMTFLQHLDELRGRLIICIVGIIVTTLVFGVLFAQTAFKLVQHPFDRLEKQQRTMVKTEDVKRIEIIVDPDGTLHVSPETRALVAKGEVDGSSVRYILPDQKRSVTIGPPSFVALTPFAAILLLIKIAIILGIVFAMPLWLWEVWLFVAPALTMGERRIIRPVLWAGIFLFPMGIAFAYLMLHFMLPYAVHWTYTTMKGVAVQMDITKYWSLALNFMLAFGLVFELPLVIVMLVQMGVTTTRTLRKARAYIVVVVFILAAVLTPSADPFNMMAMALPMWLLFESSLWVARILERKKAKAEEAEEAEERAEARANQEELEKAKAEPAEEIVVPNPE